MNITTNNCNKNIGISKIKSLNFSKKVAKKFETNVLIELAKTVAASVDKNSGSIVLTIFVKSTVCNPKYKSIAWETKEEKIQMSIPNIKIINPNPTKSADKFSF